MRLKLLPAVNLNLIGTWVFLLAWQGGSSQPFIITCFSKLAMFSEIRYTETVLKQLQHLPPGHWLTLVDKLPPIKLKRITTNHMYSMIKKVVDVQNKLNATKYSTQIFIWINASVIISEHLNLNLCLLVSICVYSPLLCDPMY